MTRTEFVNSIEKFYAGGVEILKKKNQDYAGIDDPWANFRWSQMAGVDVPHAILVRILDKMARVSNLIKRDGVVEDEKVTDTIQDCVNYLAILHAYLINETPNK